MSAEQLSRAIRRWLRALQRDATAEARKRAREDTGMIYVKRYTVQAHFRKVVPRARH